jgi:hypothetical protein
MYHSVSVNSRKLPLRDTHEKSAQYVAHRKSISKYDTYVEKTKPGAEKKDSGKEMAGD